MRSAAAIVCIAFLATLGLAQGPQNFNVFTDPNQKNQILEAYFRRLSAPRPPVFHSRDQWDARRQQVRQLVLQDLGLDPLPERVPLEARTVAAKEYDDYRLERVWYKTLPHVWASGWLYLPKPRIRDDSAKPPKYPTILNPHGHWTDGARHPIVQTRCIALAKMGYVAFAVDSLHVTHWPTGVCSVGMMTWNNMRALDYLATRSEVDRRRIGCTGASGGGQQVMYLMALDDRIQVAVPVVLISWFHRILFSSEQTHCICNHVPGLLRHTDQPEMTGLFAPKPTLYISVTGDWTAQFPKEEYGPIRAVYETLGVPERVASRQFNSGHDYNKTMREWTYAWFHKWLKGIDDPQAAREPEVKPETPQALAALDRPPADNRGNAGIVAYFLEKHSFREPQLQTRRDWDAYRQQFSKQLRNVLGEDGVQDAPLRATTVAVEKWRGHQLEKLTYNSEAEITVPAVLLRSAKAPQRAPVAIVLHPQGKAELLNKEGAFVEDLLGRGFAVLAPDVRLRGELGRRWDLNSVVWGRPEVGMAGHDVKRAVDYLHGRADVAKEQIVCVGLGQMGMAALVSGAIDGRLAGVAADDLGTTYRGKRDQPLLPRLLRYGDVPQIAALLAPRPLWLNRAAPAGEFAFVQQGFAALDAAERVHFPNLEPAAARKAVVDWLGKNNR